jgi:hypothetical protein
VKTYRGHQFPEGLAPFACRPYSWEAYVQDGINGTRSTPSGRNPWTLRPRQLEETARICRARTDLQAPGYVLNLPTGGGKTLTAVEAADRADNDRPVLVITPLATIPEWRRVIDSHASDRHQWVLINPHRILTLFQARDTTLSHLPHRRRLDMLREQGVCCVEFSTLILDESQLFCYTESQRTQLLRRLFYQFRISASATPWNNPLQTAYVAEELAWAADVEPPEDVTHGYRAWLRTALGLQLNTDADGRWQASDNAHDVAKLTRLLYDRGVGSAADVSDLGLPSQARELAPIELTSQERRIYDAAWRDFLAAHGKSTEDVEEPSIGLSMALRNLQKASRLKIPALTDIIVDYVARGYQVSCPMFFRDSVSELARATAIALEQRGLPNRVLEITGADNTGAGRGGGGADRRERKRQAFQLGAASVLIFNAFEGINLHAGERNVGGCGHDATMTPRVTVMGDVLLGGKRMLQAEGRCQRDGQIAPAIFPFTEGTIEQEWLALSLNAAANAQELSRRVGDADQLRWLANELTLSDHRDGQLRTEKLLTTSGGR